MSRHWVVLGAIVLASTAQAQLRSVSGTVRDSATGRPLAGVVIELRRDTTRRTTRSDEEGAFRLAEVPRGAHDLSVRRLGYSARTGDLDVTDNLSLEIALVPIARDLDTLYVRGGTGIYGVIGASDGLRPLHGAKIQVLGENRSRVTDSSGTFFIPLKRSGTHVVRITRPGYAHQMFPLAVQSGRATDASRLLDSSSKFTPGLEVLWQDFDHRLSVRTMNSAVVPGAELRRAGSHITSALLRSGAFVSRGLTIGHEVCVFLNGTPRPSMSLDVIPPERIEVIELYGAGDQAARDLGVKWPSGAACGRATSTRRYQPASGPLARAVARWAVVWYKPEFW